MPRGGADPAEATTERRAGEAPVSAPNRPRCHAVSTEAPQAGSAVAVADCIGGWVAVTCRRALLLHSQHQWPECWVGATVPTSATHIISQLVKTNNRRAFLVDTLALVCLRLLRSHSDFSECRVLRRLGLLAEMLHA
jgi:hypothetical protein